MTGIGDGIALTLAIALGGLLRWSLMGPPMMIPSWSWLVPVAWWVMAYNAGLLPAWGIGIVEELRRVFIQLCLVFGGSAILLFLVKQSEMTSRFTLTVAFLVSIGLVPLFRAAVKKSLIAHGVWGLPAVIYGGGEAGRKVIRALKEESGLGYRPVGVFDPNPEMWGDSIDGVPVLGPVDQNLPQASVALLAMPHLSADGVREMVDGPLSRYRKVVIIPDLIDMPTLWVESRNLAGILGLEIACRLLDPIARLTKRCVDMGVTVMLAPLWIPVCALTAAAIWIEDRHSPFFIQERVGAGGRSFKLRKFRTMVYDAEEELARRLDEDIELRAEWESNYKLKSDPRITRVGRVLRRLSLDEIPQLINVMAGDMSLVGPRPLPRYHLEELPRRVREMRARVRPGITGMWQVSGRSDAGLEGMSRWDAYYVQNWSLWLDVVILARTTRAVVRGNGAY